MIDIEIAVTPIGTDSSSVGEFVAESEKVLQNHPNISHKLTGMATEIEGDNIDELFTVLKEMHLAQITKGAKRVQTSIRIDDRRDKQCTLSQKVKSVHSRM